MNVLYLTFVLVTSTSPRIAPSITLQSLISFSEMNSFALFSQQMAASGFELTNSYGQPEVYEYASIRQFSASSNPDVRVSNQCVYERGDQQIRVGFKTADRVLYESLLQQLQSEAMQFVAQRTQKHPFMEGNQTHYRSELFPDIELELTDVTVNQYDDKSPKISWRRYGFKIVNRRP